MESQQQHDPLSEAQGWELIRTLGKGSFGSVVLARHAASREVFAVKLLPRREVSKYVEAEILNHAQMRHPHVVQFRGAFLTRRHICIAMEYATGGSLFAYVLRQGALREAVARWFFQQLVIGVDYCHRRGVANRDIKLENTLLQAVPHLPLPLVKICDFGYSKAENASAATSKVGTLTYMAPEVLLNLNGAGGAGNGGGGHDGGGACSPPSGASASAAAGTAAGASPAGTTAGYDGKVADIWSCGVMLYAMLCGRYPFESPTETGDISTPRDFVVMLERMVAGAVRFPPALGISGACQDLVRSMLRPEPQRRITVGGIVRHPWFQTNLPPNAAAMNERYLAAPPPPGAPSAAELRALIAEARGGSSSGGSIGGGAGGGGFGIATSALQQQVQQQPQQQQHQHQPSPQQPPSQHQEHQHQQQSFAAQLDRQFCQIAASGAAVAAVAAASSPAAAGVAAATAAAAAAAAGGGGRVSAGAGDALVGAPLLPPAVSMDVDAAASLAAAGGAGGAAAAAAAAAAAGGDGGGGALDAGTRAMIHAAVQEQMAAAAAGAPAAAAAAGGPRPPPQGDDGPSAALRAYLAERQRAQGGGSGSGSGDPRQ